MHDESAHQGHDSAHQGHDRFSGASGLLIGLTMLVCRGRTSRLVANRAALVAGDRVLDIGCGPGSAAREASRRGAVVTGVDPAPVMLGLGRLLSRRAPGGAITFVEGAAEAIPMPDGAATVAWAVSSAHHWRDIDAGLREVHRVLTPGGRLVVVERLTRPQAQGLAGHGFTSAKADQFAAAARTSGFSDVASDIVRAGRRTFAVITARRAARRAS